jgi:hypothetical protein
MKKDRCHWMMSHSLTHGFCNWSMLDLDHDFCNWSNGQRLTAAAQCLTIRAARWLGAQLVEKS